MPADDPFDLERFVAAQAPVWPQVAAELAADRALGARAILGAPDDVKFRSSMTLFAVVAGAGSPFASALDRYFQGVRDDATLDLLDRT